MSENRYPDALKQEGRNLTQLASAGKLVLPSYREAEVAAVLAALKRGRSVLLVGEAGVGKSCIFNGVARELARQNREVWELPTNAVLSGTRYLGEWQSKVQSILQSLRQRRGLLLLPDVWNVLTVGTSSNDPASLFDFLRPKVQTGELQLLGEVTPERFHALRAVPLLSSLCDAIQVAPLERAQITSIAARRATTRNIEIAESGIGQLLDLCTRFLPNDPGPGQVLRLLEQLADYQREKLAVNEPEHIDLPFIEKVFSIHSGLPRFVVSRTATMPARQIREWFSERIIGQERAIDAVVEVITLFKAGLHDPQRPVGTLLFVGPTGVGKTELAKSLALFLFGSETRLLRFDLSEFKDYHAFELLVGDPEKPQQPARLLDPVRAQPFQVILLDEIEKAHQNVWDMLLQLLDEGRVTPPSGAAVNFRNTIVIATSNVGSGEALKSPLGFIGNTAASPLKALEQVFRPELLNRFQHIVPFHGLTKEHVRQIARREIQRMLAREGISSRNLAVEIAEDLLDAVVDAGYDREYGARALKRQVQQRILLPIASRLMETEVFAGSILKLDAAGERPGATRVRLLESDSSRREKREARIEQAARAQRASRSELQALARTLAARLATLSKHCGKDELTQQLAGLDAQRKSAEFWRDRDAANAALVLSDDIKCVLSRLEALSSEITELGIELERAPGVQRLILIEQFCERLGSQLAVAERELMRMGPHGKADILLAIAPINDGAALRDLLFETYRGWSKWRGYRLRLLMDPLTPSDSIFCALQGEHAFGYLQREHGVHRSRHGEAHGAVRVLVAPWSHEVADVTLGTQRALKKPGKFGDKVRSVIEITSGTGFMLQNELTIAANRELAREIAPSWRACTSSDVVVRRYDFEPFLLKDYLADVTSGRQSMLRPEEFHELLCKRLDAG